MKVRLIALSSGKSKTGKTWYRATFKSNLEDGTPIVADFWLPTEVGEEAKKNGLLEDVDVIVECGMDSHLRLVITGIYSLNEGIEL